VAFVGDGPPTLQCRSVSSASSSSLSSSGGGGSGGSGSSGIGSSAHGSTSSWLHSHCEVGEEAAWPEPPRGPRGSRREDVRRGAASLAFSRARSRLAEEETSLRAREQEEQPPPPPQQQPPPPQQQQQPLQLSQQEQEQQEQEEQEEVHTFLQSWSTCREALTEVRMGAATGERPPADVFAKLQRARTHRRRAANLSHRLTNGDLLSCGDLVHSNSGGSEGRHRTATSSDGLPLSQRTQLRDSAPQRIGVARYPVNGTGTGTGGRHGNGAEHRRAPLMAPLLRDELLMRDERVADLFVRAASTFASRAEVSP
jgi:hypothetical protein